MMAGLHDGNFVWEHLDLREKVGNESYWHLWGCVFFFASAFSLVLALWEFRCETCFGETWLVSPHSQHGGRIQLTLADESAHTDICIHIAVFSYDCVSILYCWMRRTAKSALRIRWSPSLWPKSCYTGRIYSPERYYNRVYIRSTNCL